MPPTERPVSEAAALRPTDAITSGGEVDTGAFDGLRGVLALWVVLGHFCRFSFWDSSLANIFAMPLFFTLSGFVLVQAYGRQRWARVTWCEPSSGSEALPLLNSRRFLWRRLSRLVPVYYLTNLAALPVFWKVAGPTFSHASHDWFHGNEEARYAYGGFNTVLMVGTWLPFPGSITCFNGVGWFVSTIFFCYLTFPSLLPYLQECSRSTQQQWIWGACILPMVIVPLLARVIIDSSGVAMDEVILMIYKHPLYRLPQFVLGVLGGLLREAGPSLLGAEVAPSSISDWSESHTGWARVVDSTVLGIAVAFVGVEVAYELLKPNDATPDDNPLESSSGVISNLLVFLVVLPSLVMVYGLTCDGGKSFTSRALQLPAAKWLGSVSYSLYLSHFVVRRYVVFVLDTSGHVQHQHGDGYSPWFILPLAAACLPLAWLLYTFVEEPSRRYLCGLGDGPQAPLDSGSAWGTFGNFVGGNTERLSEKASDDGRAKLLESNQASS